MVFAFPFATGRPRPLLERIPPFATTVPVPLNNVAR